MNNHQDRIDLLLSRVEKWKRSGTSFLCKCPAHDDRKESLSITGMPDGSIRLKCFAGCDHRTICAALGVDPRELVAGGSHKTGNTSQWLYYDYKDESGELLYQRARIPQQGGRGKDFRQCRPDGRGGKAWTLNAGWFHKVDGKTKKIDTKCGPDECLEQGAFWLDSCRRVPYRLDQIAQLQPGSFVFVVEGEKDVHTTEGLGFVATTGGSAEGWPDEFGEYLSGLDVVICADNDDAGRKFESKVIASCRGKAARIRILRLPGLKEKQDITDWSERGGTRGKLEKLIEQAPDYEQIIFSNRIALIPTEENDQCDPPISEDPEREAWLRRAGANAGDVIDAVWLLLRMLGIRGKHSRIVNALISLSWSDPDGRKFDKARPDETINLGLVKAFHSEIHAEYDSDRVNLSEDDATQKSNRVSRDLRKFIDACAGAGAIHKTTTGCFGLLDYWKGAPEHQGRKAIAGRYRMNFLRFALLILDRAAEIGGKPREARERASREVALEVLTWVARRIAELGEQAESADEKQTPEQDSLKNLERKREAAIRAFNSYAQLLGGDRAKTESALSAISREVMINHSLSENINMASENDTVGGREFASEIEAEYLLQAVAAKLRKTWQAQGLNRGQALTRARSLLVVFVLTLFAGSEFKRRKIKSFAHSLVKESVAAVETPLTNMFVGHEESPADDPQTIESDLSAQGEFPPLARVDSPPTREQITDRGYRGPAICISSDAEIGGRITSYFEDRDGEHWVNFEAFNDPDRNGPVPLKKLFHPHDIFDESLIDRWKMLRSEGGRARVQAS